MTTLGKRKYVGVIKVMEQIPNMNFNNSIYSLLKYKKEEAILEEIKMIVEENNIVFKPKEVFAFKLIGCTDKGEEILLNCWCPQDSLIKK